MIRHAAKRLCSVSYRVQRIARLLQWLKPMYSVRKQRCYVFHVCSRLVSKYCSSFAAKAKHCCHRPKHSFILSRAHCVLQTVNLALPSNLDLSNSHTWTPHCTCGSALQARNALAEYR